MKNVTTIVGNGILSATISLDRMLKKGTKNRWIVMDYTGRLSLVLQGMGHKEIEPETVSWIDLANRNKPTAVFQLSASPLLQPAILSCLHDLCNIAGVSIDSGILQKVASAGDELSKHGSITLGTLLHCLTSPRSRQLFLGEHFDMGQLEKCVALISWCLGYPSVYACSEGKTIKQDQLLLHGKKRIIWYEMFSEHFEFKEIRLISILLVCAVELWLRELLLKITFKKGEYITMIHGFPQAELESRLLSLVTATHNQVHHVFLQNIFPNQEPGPAVIHSISLADSLWVATPTTKIDSKVHKEWLNKNECDRLNKMPKGNVLVKDVRRDKYVVARVSTTSCQLPLPHFLRRASYAGVTPIQPCRQLKPDVLVTPTTHLLYQQLCQIENLQIAWLKVKKRGSKKSHGIDGVSVGKFNEEADRQLHLLSAELTKRTYSSRPLNRVLIPKPDGGQRAIGIVCVRDKVVQTACLSLIEPLFEPNFSKFSFAFRPGRNAHQAIHIAAGYIRRGNQWVVAADIKKCFDSIDQQILLKKLEERIGDPEMLNLLENWLSIEVVDFQGVIPVISGVPQGAVLSPLLANIYLDSLDKYFENSQRKFVRYADDIVLFARDEAGAQQILEDMENFLQDSLHLALKPVKTQYGSMDMGFSFLGFTLQTQGISIHVKKMKRVTDKLKEMICDLGKQPELKEIFEGMMLLNSIIRGVRNYFALSLPGSITSQLQWLDDMVTQCGKECLPQKLREDTLWEMRERFYQPGGDAGCEGTATIAGTGYPGEEKLIHYEQVKEIRLQSDGTSGKKESEQPPEEEGEKENNVSLITVDKQIHILQHGCLLTCDDEFLIMKKRKKEIWRRRFTESTIIFIQGWGNSITTALQIALSRHHIPLFLLTMTGDIAAIVEPPVNKDKNHLRIRQAMAQSDPNMISVGLSILAAKTGNQSALLKYFAKYRKKTAPLLADKLRSAAEKITQCAESIRGLEPSMTAIRRVAMGLEGRGAAIYWNHIAMLLPENLGFTCRVTKGADDIINQCFNYTYSLLYSEVWRAVYAKGLDPCFGLMHSSKRDMGSLIFDIIEEFRVPFCDRLIVSLCGRGFIPRTGKNGTLLLKTRKILLSGFSKRWQKKFRYHSHSITPAELLRMQVKNIADQFCNEGKYRPFRMKW